MVNIIIDPMEKLKKDARREVIAACRDFMKRTGCKEDEIRYRYNGGQIEVGKIPIGDGNGEES